MITRLVASRMVPSSGPASSGVGDEPAPVAGVEVVTRSTCPEFDVEQAPDAIDDLGMGVVVDRPVGGVDEVGGQKVTVLGDETDGGGASRSPPLLR